MTGIKTRDEPVVADVMTQVVVTVEPDTNIPELVSLFATRHISGAPVVSRDGHVLGVVSTHDLLRVQSHDREVLESAYYRHDDERAHPGLDRVGREGDARTALDIATRKVVALDEQTPLSEAAKVLLELGIRRVVVTRNGRFAGILTATDVLKWVARPAVEAALAD